MLREEADFVQEHRKFVVQLRIIGIPQKKGGNSS
jgi:hypothetical protein